MLDKFFKKKCPLCDKKVDKLPHEIRMNTTEGEHSVYVCEECADFFDKSSEVLKRKE